MIAPSPPFTIMGLTGSIDVVVHPRLKETDIYLYPQKRLIICGRRSHLSYEMTKAQVRMDLRADLERQLDAFARRVGVDRSTSSE